MGDVHEQGALFFSPTGTGALADMTITSPGVIRQHHVNVVGLGCSITSRNEVMLSNVNGRSLPQRRRKGRCDRGNRNDPERDRDTIVGLLKCNGGIRHRFRR